MKDTKNDLDEGVNDFDKGYDLALELVGSLGDILATEKKLNRNHLAGVITCILNFSYVFAPSEKAVNELIDFAKEFALKESREYKELDKYHEGKVKTQYVQH